MINENEMTVPSKAIGGFEATESMIQSTMQELGGE